MTPMNSEEITLCSGSVNWGGVYLPLVSISLYMHWYPSAFGIYMFSLCTGISLYFLII